MKMLITGASGRIGSRLTKELSNLIENPKQTEIYFLENNIPIQPPTNKFKGIEIIKKLPEKLTYDFAIHLATNADVRFYNKKENMKEARELNYGLTSKVCNSSSKTIFVSTDCVFSGKLKWGESFKEDDSINPCIPYGDKKAEAEKVVLDKNGTIIRIQSMFGVQNRITDSVNRALRGKDYFPFWFNNYVRPTHFPDFSKVLKKILNSPRQGIYHVSCNGRVPSRAEIANEVLNIYKEKNFLRKINQFKYEPSPNPKTLVLDTQKTKQELGIDFTDTDKAIVEHVLWEREQDYFKEILKELNKGKTNFD